MRKFVRDLFLEKNVVPSVTRTYEIIDRNEGRCIYFQDENWVFKNMACNKVWKDIVGDANDDYFTVPSGKGERSILSHRGCADIGLLDQCMLLFRGSKSNKSADYHAEMNWDVFSHWCETKAFPSIAATSVKSVVALDRAAYHTVLDEEDKRPATSWNKPRLMESIKRWGGAPNDWPPSWIQKKDENGAIRLCTPNISEAEVQDTENR